MAAFELIEHKVVSSGTPYVEFTSIPDTYQHLYIIGSGRSTRSNYSDGSGITFNGEDDSGDYTGVAIVASGEASASTPGSWDSVGDPTTNIGYSMDSPGSYTEDDMFSSAHMWILDYTATDKFTGTIGGSHSPGHTGEHAEYQTTISHFHFVFTAAVHTVRIKNGVGNWDVGTAFTVYGIKSV